MGAMKNTILTEQEKEHLSRIGMDLQTGNNLLFRRSKEYWDFHKIFLDAMRAKDPTDKQKEIREYYKQCTNYDYWNSLPDDEKLF